MKKFIFALGFAALFLGGTSFAQNNDHLEEMIYMKMSHLDALEAKLSEETLLSDQYKSDCLAEIEMQRNFYQAELNALDQTNLKKLQDFARVHDKKNKECIDYALEKRLEMIRQKQDRLKSRWGRFGWLFN